MKTMTRWLAAATAWVAGVAAAWLLILTGAHAAGPTAAAAAGAAPGPLVSTHWLRQHLGRADVVVVDASPAPQHRQRHIPGAVPSTLFSFGPKDPPVAEIEGHLRRWGVGARQHVVVVDPGGTYMAARLVWDLVHRGFPAQRLSILDGGMAAWVAEGGAVTAEAAPAPAPGDARLGAPRPELRVHLPEFLAATADPQANVLLEALQPAYFYGGAAFFDRGGHVPHATLMPSEDFFDADKRFKKPAEIQRMLDHLGIRREQQVLTYCGGGGAAAVPWFALKLLLDYPRVRLFQESQMAWLQDERQLPVWTYADPGRVRDSAWVKAWASPMLKSFGLSRVSVVDLRPAEAWRLGHVPTSVNLPAELFERHRHEPAALAARLAEASIDPDHELVLVSDGGVTEQAALAALLLEQLGQHRVSVLLDSVERWAELGHAVARPEAVAARAPAGSASARRPRAGLLLAEPGAGAAAGAGPARFPRVFVASGARTPSRPLPGPVVHVPPSAWRRADGRPQPAAAIWAAFAKAGVPRYAEIVLVADTPGEAALGYLAMRLMGLADVKVWLP